MQQPETAIMLGHQQQQPEVAVMLGQQQPDVQQHPHTGYSLSETLIHASINPHELFNSKEICP